jgi:hypothetical protein
LTRVKLTARENEAGSPSWLTFTSDYRDGERDADQGGSEWHRSLIGKRN